MALKVTTRRAKKWFTISQDETGETEVEIAYLKPGEIADIDAECNRIVGKGVEGEDNLQTEVSFGFRARFKKILVKCLVGWKGFVDDDGEPLELTDANKLNVLKNYEWFEESINKFRIELEKEHKKGSKGAAKN